MQSSFCYLANTIKGGERNAYSLLRSPPSAAKPMAATARVKIVVRVKMSFFMLLPSFCYVRILD